MKKLTFVNSVDIWHDGKLHTVGLCSRDLTPTRSSQGHGGRNLSQLDLELPCRDDHAYTVEQLSLEGISYLHVLELFLHTPNCKYVCDVCWHQLIRWQYFCYPETTNLTLEEIDWLFIGPKAVKRSLRVAKEGWGQEEGIGSMPRQGDQGPSPSVLESGSLTSTNEKRVEENVARTDNTSS